MIFAITGSTVTILTKSPRRRPSIHRLQIPPLRLAFHQSSCNDSDKVVFCIYSLIMIIVPFMTVTNDLEMKIVHTTAFLFSVIATEWKTS